VSISAVAFFLDSAVPSENIDILKGRRAVRRRRSGRRRGVVRRLNNDSSEERFHN